MDPGMYHAVAGRTRSRAGSAIVEDGKENQITLVYLSKGTVAG